MRCRPLVPLFLLLVLAASAAPAFAVGNFDLRLGAANPPREPSPAQNAAARALRSEIEAVVTYDPVFGVGRSIYNPVGYLTPPRDAAPEVVALDYVHAGLDLLGLTAADLAELEVTDSVFSAVSGATRIYLRQRHDGLPVYNAGLQVNINRDGRVLGVGNAFVPNLAAIVNTPRAQLAPDRAIERARAHVRDLGLEPATVATDVPRPMWLPIDGSSARRVWNLQLETADGRNYFDINVDAEDGRVWTRFNWVADAAYRVYAQPTESPNHAVPPNPLPPEDGRTLEADPQDDTASPFGWHDTDGLPGAEFTILRGNNVHAYDDLDGDNQPPAVRARVWAAARLRLPHRSHDGPNRLHGGLDRQSLLLDQRRSRRAVSLRLRRAGGQLPGQQLRQRRARQRRGAGRGAGWRRDESTQLLRRRRTAIRHACRCPLFDLTDPRRDGALDAGLIVHEYGHGISNRLVGGPSNVSCLANDQQPGEGLSDWWLLAYTAQPFHAGETLRGVGTYVLGQPIDGPGVRPQPYSTDPTINDYTYESISALVDSPRRRLGMGTGGLGGLLGARRPPRLRSRPLRTPLAARATSA